MSGGGIAAGVRGRTDPVELEGKLFVFVRGLPEAVPYPVRDLMVVLADFRAGFAGKRVDEAPGRLHHFRDGLTTARPGHRGFPVAVTGLSGSVADSGEADLGQRRVERVG
ncbi:hypothetical protein, partial [Nocardia sp. CY41]|uniref:hypothetical protein n=1 Tax=Nocardia sp. CY41 TaxID=2608686 RepID=UPI001F32937A